jgi:chemotaxis protein histidine kinase CheA
VNEAWEVTCEQIRRRFASAVEAWVDDIARDVDALEAREPERVAPLFRKLHNLAGSVGTLGMHGVSTAAVNAVVICRRALDRNAAPTTEELERLRAILVSIRADIAANRTAGSASDGTTEPEPRAESA